MKWTCSNREHMLPSSFSCYLCPSTWARHVLLNQQHSVAALAHVSHRGQMGPGVVLEWLVKPYCETKPSTHRHRIRRNREREGIWLILSTLLLFHVNVHSLVFHGDECHIYCSGCFHGHFVCWQNISLLTSLSQAGVISNSGKRASAGSAFSF